MLISVGIVLGYHQPVFLLLDRLCPIVHYAH